MGLGTLGCKCRKLPWLQLGGVLTVPWRKYLGVA